MADRHRVLFGLIRGPKYHVIGNHDTDGDGRNRPNGAYAFTPEETVEYWGIQERYYSFDLRGIHFVVLDGNDKAENPAPGYRRYIGSDQVKMKIDGLESEFVGPAPWELGGTKESWEHRSLRPAISDWSMPI